MAVGESPAVARHRLRLALREAREAKGLTQRRVAKALEWSLSKVNRIENGEVTISHTDLRALLPLLGITDPDRIEELTAEARAARRRGWWDRPEYREHLTPAMIQAIQFEAEANTIRAFQPNVVPGVLQTRDYAAAIVDVWEQSLPADDAAVRVDIRVDRREHLFGRPDPPQYLLALDESVLLREVGGPRVISEQLQDLLDLIETGSLIVRIVPLARAVSAVGMFIIYADDDDDLLLYRESYLADEVVYAPEVILHHRRFFERAWENALSPEASTRQIEAHAATARAAVDRQGAA